MMSEKPFAHNSAFGDIKTNFLYHDEVADLLPKLLDQFGEELDLNGADYSFTLKCELLYDLNTN